MLSLPSLFTTFGLFTLVTLTAGAQSEMKFKVEDSTETKVSPQSPAVRFKTGSGELDTAAAPAEPGYAIRSDAPYKVSLGYPKWDFFFSYNPQNVSFSQKLASSVFSPNFSSLNYSAFSALVRLNVTINMFFETEYSQFITKGEAQSGDTLSVRESSVTADAFMIRGYSCWLGSTSDRKLCLGADLGYDSTPSLKFADNSSLEFAKIRDYMIGPSLYATMPASSWLNLQGRLAYLHGTATGQNSNLAIKSDWKVIAEGGFSGQFNDRHGWAFLLHYDLRQCKVEGARGLATESWDIRTSNLAGKLAYNLTL